MTTTSKVFYNKGALSIEEELHDCHRPKGVGGGAGGPMIHCLFEKRGEVVRKFSVRPTLTLTGRTFKGLRGWSGKPLHPPLTDFPIVAYVLAAVFDVLPGRHDEPEER